MEWVETTAKTIEEAKERALDQLGVAADEAEFEIVEEPRAGLFGRLRGEARVRARVMPTAVRPKQDRRARGRSRTKRDGPTDAPGASPATTRADEPREPQVEHEGDAGGGRNGRDRGRRPSERGRDGGARSGRTKDRSTRQSSQQEEEAMDHHDEGSESTVTPEEVGAAAVTFMSGLAEAFGADATTELEVDGSDLDVRVTGAGLGLLVGPGGRTLLAVQDLARVASQRRLGDHATRLRIDVGGYREKRREALEQFAVTVAREVVESGRSRALEPMSSADRKIVHDAVIGIDGVSSRSEGDDPMRRVVISPA